MCTGVISGAGSELVAEEDRAALNRLELADTLATQECGEAINRTELRQTKKRSSDLPETGSKKQKPEPDTS